MSDGQRACGCRCNCGDPDERRGEALVTHADLTDQQRDELAAALERTGFLPSNGNDQVDWSVARSIAYALDPTVARMVADARAEALREAADALTEDWVKRGRHQGVPGCYSPGYEHWLRDRAARIARDGGDPDDPCRCHTCAPCALTPPIHHSCHQVPCHNDGRYHHCACAIDEHQPRKEPT